MKPLHSLLVLLFFALLSVVAGYGSYSQTRLEIISDLNQALATTLQANQQDVITPDTIRSYRANLTLPQLKKQAYVAYSLRGEQSAELCSDSMLLSSALPEVACRGYANCSFLTVWGMSDQRWSLSFTIMAMLWAAFSVVYFQRKRQLGLLTYGQLTYSQASDRFLNAHGCAVSLTPLQHQLLRLFFLKADHRLAKQDICNRLWPKKPDASGTLYTLISRLKPTLEAHSSLRIEPDQGGSYRLTEQ